MKIPNFFNVMLVKDKKPLTSWKELTEREQTSEERAKVLEVAQPGTLGIVTGSISRLFVLDIDGAEGEKAIEKFHIPRTPKVRTPHGCHYYFRWTDELDGCVTTRAGIFNKVDVRGDGGYVVFYGWSLAPTLVPLAAPPTWLVDALPKKESRQISAGPMATLSSIREGNRNQSFTSLAGGLRARGYTTDVIFELLRPKAREVQFPESELMAVCQSIGRYDAPKLEGQGESVEDFLADRQDVKWICEPFIAEQSIGFIAGLPESRKSWILIDLAVACASGSGLWLNKYPINSTSPKQPTTSGDLTKRPWNILSRSHSVNSMQKSTEPLEPMLPVSGPHKSEPNGTLISPSTNNSGSRREGEPTIASIGPITITPHIGLNQAGEQPHGGHRVLLIDQERSKGETQRRLRAVIAGRGLRVADIKTTLFVRSSTSTRLDSQTSYDSLKKELSELRPTLLLVDSFATFHTKNESNRMEIQQVLERIKEIRNEFKCSIVLIHHETKAAYAGHKEGQPSSYLDMAGNVAIPAAAEFCMNVTKRDDDSSWCHHTKSTQGMKTGPFVVTVKDVDGNSDKIRVEAF